MKRLLSYFIFLFIVLMVVSCSSTDNSVDSTIVEDEDTLVTEEIEGNWEGTVVGDTNQEYEILLTLNNDGKFTYQEGAVTTGEENQKLLSGLYEVDDNQLILIVDENQDIPDALIIGDETEFTYELSTDYLELTDSEGNIINLTREGIKANQ